MKVRRVSGVGILGERWAIFSEPLLLACVTIFLIWGSIAVYSATYSLALDKFSDSFYFLKRHFFSVFLGVLGLLFTASLPSFRLRRYLPWLMLGVLGALILVKIPGFGVKAGGAVRWLQIRGVRIGQPGELAKVVLIIYLADFLSRKRELLGDFFRGFLPPLSVVGVYIVLLMLQPDFGTSMMLLIILFSLLFIAGTPLLYILGSFVFGLPVIYLMVILAPYRWRRITAFLDPFSPENIRNGAYQLVQSLKGFSSGGLWGMGVGAGKQKLGYLPEAHTDFIFSVVGEDFGFFGVAFFIFLALFFLYRGFRISLRAGSDFERYLAFGITTFIGFQIALNIGVVTGALPTKGMPLPFFSFARSSMVVILSCVGILLRIEFQNRRRQLEIV